MTAPHARENGMPGAGTLYPFRAGSSREVLCVNVTDAFVHRIEQYLRDEYSPEAGIRLCLKDYTAVLFGGSQTLKDRHGAYLERFNKSGGNGVVVGLGRAADGYTAALLNGLSAHALELDDGHRYGMLHPGVPVFSALLAAAAAEHIPADRFFRGAAAGYDAMIRLAFAVQPDHKKRGFHASATCGAIGAAVALAVARGYDSRQLKDTVSAAATSASGLLEMMDDDSELKPYNCAQSAVNGMLAANVGFCGYRGPNDALGGKRGFIRALNGELDEAKLRAALDMRNCVETVYRKLYASCRHTHPAVEAALKLREKTPDISGRIRRVEIRTYDLAVFGHDNPRPGSAGAAKMSTPYSVAVALLYGKSSIDAFTDALLKDQEVQRLSGAVSMFADEGLSKLTPGVRAAVVAIETADGARCEERVDYPKGEPENPLSEAEFSDKFKLLLRAANRDEAYIRALETALDSIDTQWQRYMDLIAQ